MLLVGGLLLVSLVGLVVLGLLCLGLWRRLVALLAEVASLGERLAAVGDGHRDGRDGDLERDLAALREKYPGLDVEVAVRQAPDSHPARTGQPTAGENRAQGQSRL